MQEVHEVERLRTELRRIRHAVTVTYGENYAGENVAAEVERLFRHLSEFETDMRRLLQAKSEALEQAQSERDARTAAIERVRAMRRSPGIKSVSSFTNGQDDGWDQALAAVRAALAVPESTEVEADVIWDVSVMRDRLTEAEAWRDKYRMERDRYRTAWRSARSRAKAYGESIGRLCEERDTCLEWFNEAKAALDARGEGETES